MPANYFLSSRSLHWSHGIMVFFKLSSRQKEKLVAVEDAAVAATLFSRYFLRSTIFVESKTREDTLKFHTVQNVL